MKKFFFLFFLVLLCLISIPCVSAAEEDEVNLSKVPDRLAEMLNIDLFSARLLASAILLCLFLFPGMLIAGYFGGEGSVLYSILVIGLPLSGFCVALGWLPVWLFLVVCLLIALLFSGAVRKWISGGLP